MIEINSLAVRKIMRIAVFALVPLILSCGGNSSKTDYLWVSLNILPSFQSETEYIAERSDSGYVLRHTIHKEDFGDVNDDLLTSYFKDKKRVVIGQNEKPISPKEFNALTSLFNKINLSTVNSEEKPVPWDGVTWKVKAFSKRGYLVEYTFFVSAFSPDEIRASGLLDFEKMMKNE